MCEGEHHILKPENCSLAIGIPTCEEEFRRRLELGSPHFSALFHGGWPRYQREVVTPFLELEEFVSGIGARVLRDVGSIDFGAALATPGNLLTILVSHWDENECRVEMREGMVGIESMVDRVPEQFGGVLDCCICLPQALVKVIRKKRSTTRIFFSETRRTPLLWFNYYGDLFWYLHHYDKDYLTATEEVMGAWVSSPQ